MSLPEGVRAMFPEEVPEMPWRCHYPEHGADAHKHVGIGARWFYKPAENREEKP